MGGGQDWADEVYRQDQTDDEPQDAEEQLALAAGDLIEAGIGVLCLAALIVVWILCG